MSLTVSERRNERGAFEVIWTGPTVGVDDYSGETQLLPGHVPFIQNMHLELGTPVGVDGYNLLDTNMDADDNATPLGFGQLIQQDATETYVIVQADGVVQKWDSATNLFVHLFTYPTTPTGLFNTQVVEDVIVFCSPTSGNWKYDGTNWLPLGAKIINTAEATTDWALTGTGSSGLTVSAVTFAFGLNSITFDAMLLDEVATLTYDPTTLNVDTGLNLARAYTEDDRLEFWVRFTDVSTIDTTNTLVRIETSSGNDFDIAASAWTDETGTTITLADNTWHRVSVVISGGTAAGTYDHTSVDNIQFVFDTNGTGGTTVFLDQVYMTYAAGSTMPGVQTLALWGGVLFGAGATSTGESPADFHFTPAGAPDEYNALAFQNVDSEDGGSITVLRRFFNQLFIGKSSSCHSLGGSISGTVYPNFNYEVLDVTAEHGADGHRGMTEADRKLWFTWHRKLYSYDGTGTREEGERIQPDLDDHSNTRLDQKTMVYWHPRNEIWCGYPGSGDTNNARRWRYNVRNSGFVEAIDSAAALNLNLLLIATESGLDTLVGIDEAGDIMRLDDSTATDFDGTAIVRTFRLPWSDGGDPQQLKYWGDLTVLFGFVTSGTITVQFRVADHPKEFDSASFVTAATVDTATADELGWIQISELSRYIQIQFTATAVNFDLQYPIKWEATPMGRWA